MCVEPDYKIIGFVFFFLNVIFPVIYLKKKKTHHFLFLETFKVHCKIKQQAYRVPIHSLYPPSAFSTTNIPHQSGAFATTYEFPLIYPSPKVYGGVYSWCYILYGFD